MRTVADEGRSPTVSLPASKGVTLAGEMAGDGEHAVTMVTGESPAFVIAPGVVDVTISNIMFVNCVPSPELPDQIE